VQDSKTAKILKETFNLPQGL